ncbi:MAG: FMN-binding glutamate synthase family protein [Rickettsiales bacterium]|nr:MAG: FMN-binding glutamate synthase family protein [Rickettsiales bacterium]
MNVRWLYYTISTLSLLLFCVLYPFWPDVIYGLFILIPYIIIGLYDIFSTKHTILRNYPVIGHFRYIFELIRPEIQQYFVENDMNGTPYSRETRSLIYQTAKGVSDTIPFGTKNDITSVGYQFSYHSLAPKTVLNENTRIIIGGPDCKKPYESSRLNISGMSFGAISPNAIRALNKGAKLGNFAHNTGEGGISSYHLENGGDIVWQIGTGYFGCRYSDGRFNPDAFEKAATQEVVKMIEIKLSQGAKPAHGGILPAAKVTTEIANIRMLEPGQDAISPAMHPEFSTPIGLLEFVAKLRHLSGGKPVGFKLCLGHKVEFMAICKAMLETGIKPDFITIDGAEGGSGAAPVTFTNRLGTPINEAITFVNNCLVGSNLKKDIKIIASGKIATGYDMITKIALGADCCNVARAMMFALGCIQSLSCNTDKCPTGIATQNKHRWSSLDVSDKSVRVYNFQRKTVHSFFELVGALGLDDPDQLNSSHIRRYADVSTSKSFANIYPHLKAGELLDPNSTGIFADTWKQARAESF